jgi:single-strand DNA-binding protein
MPSLNKVMLIGHLGKEPETRFIPTGKKICTFSLAVDHRWKAANGETKSSTDWFNIEMWGRLGEICQQYLHKGRLVYIEGRLRTDRYEDKGETHFITRVVGQRMQMLQPPPEEEEPTLPEGEEDIAEDTAA